MISPSRRQLLALGLGGAATAIGGVGLWQGTRIRPGPGTAGTEMVEPEVLASRDGLLELDLEAAPAQLPIGNRDVSVLTFNGSLPGPTLRVAPGDTIRVRMHNSLDAPTNLHVHGLHVSPEDNGDNPFISIDPGQSFDYEFALPDDHPQGTYWYHPHRHGYVADQLTAGLYGAILVEDREALPMTRERLMIVSDLSVDASGNLVEPDRMQQMMGREGDLVLINGQLRPSLTAAPGDRERWRIINACTSRFLRLQLDGQRLQLLSRDLGRLPAPQNVSEVVVLPGNRVELLVEAEEGTASLVAAPVDRGRAAGMMGGGPRGRSGPGEVDPFELATFSVTGNPVEKLPPVPPASALRDLREEPVTERREFDFAMGMGPGGMDGGRMGTPGGGGMMTFTINGQEFAHDRTDAEVRSGTVEEWTLSNSSPMDHPVHLHVWPMQVIEQDGRAVGEAWWQDVVNVPAFGEVKVLIAFDDFTGRSVFHCHILDHEDLGMMGTVEAS
ncbi:multicopper oxidase family protein [Brevibacterium samyangense]|uniref:Copper-containing nitrite reductase n=1 Tax=Brevibacterium samyangense TaxID=366888 RepID=A0ABP5EPY2_9MICO